MRLLFVNPNTTATMTAAIAAAAASCADPATVVEAVNPPRGPASIENDDDERLCVPGLLAEITTASNRSAAHRPDAYVIACFGDPGLIEARRLVGTPVLGIAQAAMHAAALLAGRYSVVTSMAATIPRAWELARAYTTDACAGVYACDIPVLRIDDDASFGPIAALCERALATDDSGAVVLGCAAMARFAQPLRERLGVAVIDGVQAATRLAEALVPLGGAVRSANEFCRAMPEHGDRGVRSAAGDSG
ncbi:aspartate/glutamate racemase family protein [Mycolicibacterium sp. CBM1]